MNWNILLFFIAGPLSLALSILLLRQSLTNTYLDVNIHEDSLSILSSISSSLLSSTK